MVASVTRSLAATAPPMPSAEALTMVGKPAAAGRAFKKSLRFAIATEVYRTAAGRKIAQNRGMPLSALAGKPAPANLLVNVPRLVTRYFSDRPDPGVRDQRVSFGTSGHRGSAFTVSFNEGHILAITQAICRYRREQGIDGPLFLAMDTHALSEPAFASALEVLAANGLDVMIDQDRGYTPTPVLSHAILTYNRGRKSGLADGIVITPSHNPPEDGGFKYNPPHGGPADTEATGRIEREANALIGAGLRDIRRIPLTAALAASTTHKHDYISAYVADLGSVVDM